VAKKRVPLWFEGFDTISRIHEEVHRLMKEAFLGPAVPVDVEDRGKKVIVRADLPGFTKEEITVRVSPSRVVIEAEKKSRKTVKKDSLYLSERSYGSVRRVVSLPSEVDPEKGAARFENGVLEIELPKVSSRKERKLRVE